MNTRHLRSKIGVGVYPGLPPENNMVNARPITVHCTELPRCTGPMQRFMRVVTCDVRYLSPYIGNIVRTTHTGSRISVSLHHIVHAINLKTSACTICSGWAFTLVHLHLNLSQKRGRPFTPRWASIVCTVESYNTKRYFT